jgi:hypothetical protein
MMITTIGRRPLLPLLMALTIGCDADDVPTLPQTGSVAVSVQMSGGDPDIDGFEFVVGGVRQLVFGNAGGRLDDIAAGTHAVTLEKIAENCSVTGANPQPATVTGGGTANVVFEVVCVPTGITVTTRTTGVYVPDSYDVIMNGESVAPIAANSSLTVGRLRPGPYIVTLANLREHCSVAGPLKVAVDVAARTVIPVGFDITCVAPVRREVIAYTIDTVVGRLSERWIGVVDPNGAGVVTLLRGHSPTWSPDGTTLLFSTTDCSDFYYYGYQCSGGLTTIDPETGRVGVLSGGFGGLQPAWSPTGDAIAFVKCCEFGIGPTRLFRLELDGSATLPLSIAGVVGPDDPAWSPDGQRIAFACRVQPGHWDLCVVDRNGSSLVRLTSDVTDEREPSWSPDGKRIAFTRGGGAAKTQVALIDLGDRTVTPITDGWDPDWSRDGTKLVFMDFVGLHTINADGSNRRHLLTGVVDAPAWRPSHE